MLIYDPLHPLQSYVLQALAEQPGSTIENIHTVVNMQIPVSRQNLYKIVAKLIETQVLVKKGKGIFFHASWLDGMCDLFNNAKIQQEKNQQIEDVLLQDGERKEYIADSLTSLDVPWGHMMDVLTSQVHAPDYFLYHSHSYYYPTMNVTELRLWASLHRKGIHMHHLIGNSTFLDKYAVNASKMPGTEYIFTDSPPFLKKSYQLNVYGEYIFEVIIPEEISQRFEYFYQTVQNIEDFNVELFADIFKMKSKCKLIYRRSKKDTGELRKKFGMYFKNINES